MLKWLIGQLIRRRFSTTVSDTGVCFGYGRIVRWTFTTKSDNYSNPQTKNTRELLQYNRKINLFYMAHIYFVDTRGFSPDLDLRHLHRWVFP